MVAFTSTPATVSRSAAYKPTTWHVNLTPDAVNSVVPVGQPVVVRAQLLNSLDGPVKVNDEPIYLGQISYVQEGLKASTAVINGMPPGSTPVVGYTNRNGVATFVLRGTTATSDPVYFEANIVNLTSFYPYGYSQILPIRFGP